MCVFWILSLFALRKLFQQQQLKRDAYALAQSAYFNKPDWILMSVWFSSRCSLTWKPNVNRRRRCRNCFCWLKRNAEKWLKESKTCKNAFDPKRYSKFLIAHYCAISSSLLFFSFCFKSINRNILKCFDKWWAHPTHKERWQVQRLKIYRKENIFSVSKLCHTAPEVCQLV